MQLYLIRHGESANNLTARETGVLNGGPNRVPDPPLTEVGHRQGQLLGRWWAQAPSGAEPPTHLYCSLPLRAIETAGAIARELSLATVRALEEWFEVGGVWETGANGERVGRPGLAPAELAERFGWLLLPDKIDPLGWHAPRAHEERSAARGRRSNLTSSAGHGALVG